VFGVPKDELEIERADAFLQRERTAQRIGTLFLLLFVIAGAAGLFGDGPLSHVSNASQGMLLEYERFGRATDVTTLAVTVETAASDGNAVRVRMPRTFLSKVWVVETRPQDAFRGFEGDAAVFQVDAADGRARFELLYKPNRFGVLRAVVQPENGTASELRQLIFF